MPEYLSPGVYVEEIDTGNKPIEGVSTSTAGMLGVTERGPVNVPILITSYGEYRRWFGERLPLSDFSNAAGPHCFLPHAVEGFFQNEGKRVYVTRVLDMSAGAAANATELLFDRGDVGAAATLLLRAAGEETGTAGNPPLLFVLDDTGLTAGTSWIRIGDGSTAEYRMVDTMNATPAHMLVALAFALQLPHAAADAVDEVSFTVPGAFSGTLSHNVNPGALEIDLTFGNAGDIALITAGHVVEIGGATGEFHVVKLITPGPLSATVVLETPLEMSHASGAAVLPLTVSAPINSSTLALPAGAADSLVFLNTATGFATATHLVRVHSSITNQDEFSRIGAIAKLEVAPGAFVPYPAGSIVEKFNLADDGRHLAAAGVAATNTITLDDASGLNAGDQLIIEPGVNQETVAVQSVNTTTNVVTLTANLNHNHPADRHLAAGVAAGVNTITLDDASGLQNGDQLLIDPGINQETMTVLLIAANVVTLTVNLANAHPAAATVVVTGIARLVTAVSVTPKFSLKALTADAQAGSRVIALDNRMSLAVDDVIRIGIAPNDEYATITGLPDPSPVSPDAGTVLLDHALLMTHASGAAVRRQTPAAIANPAPPVSLALPVAAGSGEWVITDTTNYFVAPLEFARVTTATGQVFFHRLLDTAAPVIHPAEIAVKMPPPAPSALERAHAAGSVVVARNPLIQVEAIDPGAWGDRLRISVEDETPGLVSRTQLTTIVNPTHIRLASVAGVESGTVLELLDPLNNDAVVGDPIKVVAIDRTTNYTLTLAGTGLSAAQQAAQAAAVVAHKQLGVRSREFRLTVLLMHQPDPSLPSRSEQVVDSEVFRNLSMDSRHSRYFQTIIGDIGGPLRLEDRRPEGESWYVRVHDLAQDLTEPARTNTLESVRLGPETLIDILPNGRPRAARQALEGGNDSIATLTDDVYTGQDDVDPEKRTGLFTFVNVDEISIVSVPGRTSPVIQGALIDFCENNRYCFAVLDGPVPPIVWQASNDSLADVQQQRQQFDTKYAALYHPWLLIEDPFPVNLAKIAHYPVPPSGHVIGVYARTDVERGVHKAPANEVVSGIIGLQRIINKPEQDILNPYPVNINVIRDFRPNERGIRIWGGRVITSDTDWKYVNVRRLLIFIEKSVDRGLQWVVFEPNAEPLWARVRRTIGNFLTTVWRNGGLEGTKPEEAYFVKCDRTTMTQTDIDNGKLIAVVGVAPVKPAEFVIIRIGLWTANASS
jgi:phage tail sheath protein FI